jgi:hypothetical protein
MRRIPFAALAWALAVLVAAYPSAAGAAPQRASGGIHFTYLDPNAKLVSWVGAFNGWNVTATPMTKNADRVWSVVVPLPPGDHEYKFVVDGSYVADPENPATHGDYGNSYISIGPDGDLKAVAATANTTYNPKLLMGGRGVATYQLTRNPEANRFELHTPSFDFGLKFDIRISDLMSAQLIMNTTNTNGYNGTLDLERGSIEFRGRRLTIRAFDNAAVDTWDDPLHLVGNIGIYGYRFGYNRQGFLFHSLPRGFETEVLFADNFVTGGTSYPSAAIDVVEFLKGFPVVPSGSGYAAVVGSAKYSTTTNLGDGNENTLALRVHRDLPFGVRAGLQARNDRGFDLSQVVTARMVSPNQVVITATNSDHEWWGGGPDVRWNGPHGFGLNGELLVGVKRLNGLRAMNSTVYNVHAEATGLVLDNVVATPVSDPDPEDHDLDRSTRYHVGGEWIESHGDIRLKAAYEGESHDYRFIDDGISNSTQLLRLKWDRNWRYYLNRELLTGLGVDWQTFDYDPRTPWTKQLWFPEGNFWYEHGEHVVSFDKLVMLGGGDVVSVKPALEIPIWRRRDLRLGWNGTFNTPSLSKRPKYLESIFRLGVDVFQDLRLSTDVRWVKYDDPVLSLFHGYQESFTQLRYQVSPDIHVSLGFGVDPEVTYRLGVDEYSLIGRDQFLFAAGANAANAQTNFYGLGAQIEAAESALRDVRIIQVKGTVDF